MCSWLFTPYTSYLHYRIFKTGYVQLKPEPTNSGCHVFGSKVDSHHDLQCDMCDVRLQLGCVDVDEQKLCAFETYNIPFMWSTCEGNEIDNNDIKHFDEL